MIVTCEGCKARFKFDETRIKPQGIKVHCSKCRHTFVLKPVARAADPPVIRTGPPEKPRAPAPGAPASALAGDGAPETDLAAPGGAPDPPDDPLADVPGFEPESRPGPSPEEEEKKALAGLAQNERVDASVGEALGLFQASEETEAAESGDAAETAAPGLDNFDWDQVSFTDNTGAPADAAAEAAAEAPGADSDNPEIVGIDDDFLAGDEEEKAPEAPEKAAPPQARRGPPPPGEGDGQDLELDLSHVAPKREATLAGAREAAPPEPPAAAPAVSRAPQRRVSAKVRVPKPLVQAFRTRTGQPRPRLALPRLPTIIASAVLAVVAAAAGVILAYGPFTGYDFEARPAGAASASIVLAIEDAQGVMVDPLDGRARYVVTGRAHWKGEPGATYYLEGVITSPQGKVLERRAARLGAAPEWKVIEEVDPDLFAAKESIPGEGEIPFTVLFTPEPSWQGDVHFELSASP